MNTFENLQNAAIRHPITLAGNLPDSLESLFAMSNFDTSKCCGTGTCS